MAIDEIDAAIIRELVVDGRLSVSEVARTIGAGRARTASRIDDLVRTGVIDVIPIPLIGRRGPGTSAIVGVNVLPESMDGVIRALEDVPEVLRASTTTGRYDAIVEVTTAGPLDMFDLVRRRMAAVPGVREQDVHLVLRQAPVPLLPPGAAQHDDIAARSVAWTGETPSTADHRAVAIDDLDAAIVDLLSEDGRRGASEIGRQLSVSVSTVAVRIQRLAATGVCKVVAVLDPVRAGYASNVQIGVRVMPTQAERIGDVLAGLPGVAWVRHLSSWYDLLIEVWLESGASMSEYVDTHLRRLGTDVLDVEAFEVRVPLLYERRSIGLAV